MGRDIGSPRIEKCSRRKKVYNASTEERREKKKNTQRFDKPTRLVGTLCFRKKRAEPRVRNYGGRGGP